jgi:hypothetical protein
MNAFTGIRYYLNKCDDVLYGLTMWKKVSGRGILFFFCSKLSPYIGEYKVSKTVSGVDKYHM